MDILTDHAPNGKKASPVMDESDFINGLDWKQEDSRVLPLEGESYQDKFRKSILDQTKEYPQPEPIVSIIQNGTELPLLTLMSFSLWQGKQKSKKTTVLAMAVAAFLRGRGFIQGNTEIIGTANAGLREGVVLFFNCEQGESYAAKTMKRILRLAGMETSLRLIYCNLREHVPEERRKIIEAAIECTPNVKMVVVDGIIDLLTDPAEPKEGHTIATTFLRWSSQYNIHVAGVLHQNKADKNARFHVGPFCSQKCEIEISTEVDSNEKTQSIVTCVNSRGMSFEDFAISWPKGTALPQICQDWGVEGPLSEPKANTNFNRNRELAEAVFKPLACLSHAEAVTALMQSTQKSESTAKRLLNDLQLWGFVSKGEDNLYRLKVVEGSRVYEGSNEGS